MAGVRVSSVSGLSGCMETSLLCTELRLVSDPPPLTTLSPLLVKPFSNKTLERSKEVTLVVVALALSELSRCPADDRGPVATSESKESERERTVRLGERTDVSE